MDGRDLLAEPTDQLNRCIAQLNAGDASVRGELLNLACQRLRRLTERICRNFPTETLRGRSTDQLLEEASTRLYQALFDQPIIDARHFYQLAARQIRRELVDWCGAEPVINRPTSARRWLSQSSHLSQFHLSVGALPDAQREVFELVWYHELSRSQAAELLGVSLDEVRRQWRAARLTLHELLDDE